MFARKNDTLIGLTAVLYVFLGHNSQGSSPWLDSYSSSFGLRTHTRVHVPKGGSETRVEHEQLLCLKLCGRIMVPREEGSGFLYKRQPGIMGEILHANYVNQKIREGTPVGICSLDAPQFLREVFDQKFVEQEDQVIRSYPKYKEGDVVEGLCRGKWYGARIEHIKIEKSFSAQPVMGHMAWYG